MREIKFRNWVKEVRDGNVVMPGYMDYDPDWQNVSAIHHEKRIQLNKIGETEIKIEKARLNDIFKHSDALMQYTGIKDKNGTEIYEGDIVEEGGQKSIVKWSESLTGFEPFNDYDSDCQNYFPALKCEVVGHIYEQPKP